MDVSQNVVQQRRRIIPSVLLSSWLYASLDGDHVSCFATNCLNLTPNVLPDGTSFLVPSERERVSMYQYNGTILATVTASGSALCLVGLPARK